MDTQETIAEVRATLTLTELGVIVSLVTSAVVGVFSLGVVYAQVNQNTADIADMEPKVEDNQKRLERIDANVEFLTELAREERAAK